MTETMFAVKQTALGGPEVLEGVEVPRPVLKDGEILVKVHAAGVNPIDWKVRAHGYWFTPPLILGWDVSGTVVEVSPGENRFEVGDEVFGMPHFPNEAGGYAEYVAAPARHFARKPANLDHTEAAVLPLAGLTAWQALVEAAKVQPGQRVLIHAAAGGVGHLAVQIAKSLNAHVIGTAGEGKHAFLKDLGADELVDYRTRDFSEIEPVDVVIDLIGGADYEDRSIKVLRDNGVYVGVPDPFALAELRKKSKNARTVMVAGDHAVLEHLADLTRTGALRPIVAETFPLADAAKAHEVGEAGRTTGKIVLTVD